jgi:hypothetical protein
MIKPFQLIMIISAAVCCGMMFERPDVWVTIPPAVGWLIAFDGFTASLGLTLLFNVWDI